VEELKNKSPFLIKLSEEIAESLEKINEPISKEGQLQVINSIEKYLKSSRVSGVGSVTIHNKQFQIIEEPFLGQMELHHLESN